MATSPTLTTDTVARIAEYLALACTTNAGQTAGLDAPTSAQFTRANELAAYLQMTLPADLWHVIARNIMTAFPIEAIMAVRGARKADAISPDLFVWHWPGLGKPRAN